MVVVCGDETQQELIPFGMVGCTAGIAVTEIDGVRRHDAQELTATKTARRMRHQ
jgi:hypothetical protein